MSKTVDGETTTHILVGSNIVLELDSSGNVSDKYTRGINLIKSEFEYCLYNAHGDVVQLVDEDGTVVKDYRYDAFGVAKNQDREDTNAWRFCGEYFDVESGLIYLRARYMNPEARRFLSEDTHWNTKNMIYGDKPQKIRESKDALGLNVYTYAPDINAVRQSSNLYAYGMSNLIMYQDPSGHVAILAIAFISVFAGMLSGTITGAVDSYSRYGELNSSVMLDWTLKGIGLGSIGALGIASAGALAAVGTTAVAGAAGGGGVLAAKQITEAILKVSSQSINHIMDAKHAWDKVVTNVNWNSVQGVIQNTMQKGTTTIIVLELDFSGNVLDKYTRGINLIKSSDLYYLYNAHGDIVQLTDEAGTVVKDYRFGVEADKDSADGNPFRYCGEYWDEETDAVYLRGRYYDPSTGRFTQEDTVRDGLNWYTYCCNNPVRYFDPTGHVVAEWDINHLTDNEIARLQYLSDNWAKADEKTCIRYQNEAETMRAKYRKPYEYTRDDGITVVDIAKYKDWYGSTKIGMDVFILAGAEAAVVDGPLPIDDVVAGGIMILGASILFVSNVVSILNDSSRTVSEILKEKKGNIKNAPLPPGTSGWDVIGTLTLEMVRQLAKDNATGFKTILKLLTDGRFNR